MRKKDFKGKCFKQTLPKCKGICKTYDDIQTAYAIILKDPLAQQYMETEMRFSIMMKDVYEILGEVTGMGDLLG